MLLIPGHSQVEYVPPAVAAGSKARGHEAYHRTFAAQREEWRGEVMSKRTDGEDHQQGQHPVIIVLYLQRTKHDPSGAAEGD